MDRVLLAMMAQTCLYARRIVSTMVEASLVADGTLETSDLTLQPLFTGGGPWHD